jgi:hypothetical protein
MPGAVPIGPGRGVGPASPPVGPDGGFCRLEQRRRAGALVATLANSLTRAIDAHRPT